MIGIFVRGVLRFWRRWLCCDIVQRNVNGCLTVIRLYFRFSFFGAGAAFGEPLVLLFVAGAAFGEPLVASLVAGAAFGASVVPFFVASVAFGELLVPCGVTSAAIAEHVDICFAAMARFGEPVVSFHSWASMPSSFKSPSFAHES